MNRKYLVTVAWIVVAALTFALGWTLKRAPELPDSPAGNGALAAGKAPADSSSSQEGDDSAAKAEGAADNTNSDSERFELEAVRVLNSADIEDLGQTFKTTLDPIERRLAFAQLLAGLTADNALKIRKQIEHLPADSSEFREFHYAWGKIGGEDAVIHGAGTEKPDMAATIAGWASADPDAAIAWLKGLDMENDPRFDVLVKDREIATARLQSHFEEGMVRGLASRDTGLATAFVLELANAGNERAKGMIGIVSGNVLRAGGPEAAAQWAGSLPAGEVRGTAMAKVAYAYAQRDPEAAAAWASQLGGDDQNGWVVGTISHQLARRDGEAAVGWLDSLDAAAQRPEAYRAAFEGWADKNPVAASAYLAEMPQSPARDQAISGLVNRHRWEDPVASIVWAESISSEKTRLEALTRAGQAWTRKDPNAAFEWATSSGLPEKLKQSIINPPKGRK